MPDRFERDYQPGGRLLAGSNAVRDLCPAPPGSAVTTFDQAVAPKSRVAPAGSSGFLEVAINRGSAEKTLGVRMTRVVLRRHSSPLAR